MNPDSARRLGALARARERRPAPVDPAAPRLIPPAIPESPPTPIAHAAGNLAAWIAGEQRENARGTHWRSERSLSGLPDLDIVLSRLADSALWPAEAEALAIVDESGSGSLLFLDLETCGFAGTPLFLSGLMLPGPDGPRLIQLLARTYAEEASVVMETLAVLAARPLLVTFNGRSYDIPFLGDRARRHGLEPVVPAAHLDLLHAARRRWRDILPDCRLTTLETRLTGRRRAGDVPGREVPERFHAFARSGDPRGLVPVLRHNLMDLLTLAEILAALPSRPAAAGSAGLTSPPVQG